MTLVPTQSSAPAEPVFTVPVSASAAPAVTARTRHASSHSTKRMRGVEPAGCSAEATMPAALRAARIAATLEATEMVAV